MKANIGMSALQRHPHHQGGASLIMVMIVLTIVSIIGVAGIQISLMSERGARNDRDQQIAWQSAEAALLDAAIDIYGPGTPAQPLRRAIFTPGTNLLAFADGCGTSGSSIGLCSLVTSGRPTWLTAAFDFSATGSSAPSAAYGTYTGRAFQAGGVGTQPAQAPRYVIEPIRDFGADRELSSTTPAYMYRVTAMGFGPRSDIQAVLQMIYRN